MIWFADFETCKYDDQNSAGVYLGYIENLESNLSTYFLNIDEMFNFLTSMKTKERHIVYFHNLTWDAEFIVWWLIENNFEPVINKVEKAGQFKERTDYLGTRSELYLNIKGKKILFLDSYKLWPYKLEEIGQSLGFEKLNIEHKNNVKFKNINEVPKNILDYVKRDVQILKLKYINYSKNYDIKKTASSSSWSNFKKWFKNNYEEKQFKFKYSIPEHWHSHLSFGYFGGLTQINEKYINLELNGTFNIYDVNSSYPSIFVDNLLPYGTPQLTKPDGDYCEIIEAIISNVKKKDKKMINHLHNWTKYGKMKNLYLENFEGSMKVMYIKQEWEELKLTYDFDIIERNSIYFKASKELGKYIQELYHLKENETDKILRTDHKQILNTFTGKWGQNYLRNSKLLRLANATDDRKYHYQNYVYDVFFDKSKEIKYIPIAIFVTGLARVKLLKAIRSNINDFIYCDTDSIIFLENKNGYGNIKIDDTKLGFWKLENVATKIKILKPKFYMMQLTDGTFKKILAGINKECHLLYNFDNFCFGSKIKNGNIKKRKLKGGYVLENEDVVI